MEFLQANWLWILLGLGVVWVLFFRRGGMGCGMGEHGSHGSRTSIDARGATQAHGVHNGHGSGESPEGADAEAAAPRRRGGCC